MYISLRILSKIFAVNTNRFLLYFRYVCLLGSTTPTPNDGIQGYVCTPGYYCPAGSTVPLGCDSGTFNQNYGQETCQDCLVGMMCPDVNMTYPLPCKTGPLIKFSFPKTHTVRTLKQKTCILYFQF